MITCSSARGILCQTIMILRANHHTHDVMFSQETMEDVYIHHLPHLCWFTLHTLSSQETLSSLKPRSLQHCLDLLLSCTQRIVQESSSHSASPATTPTGIMNTLSCMSIYTVYIYVCTCNQHSYAKCIIATIEAIACQCIYTNMHSRNIAVWFYICKPCVAVDVQCSVVLYHACMHNISQVNIQLDRL